MQEGDTELGGLQIPHGNNVNPPTPTPGPQPVASAAPQNPQPVPQSSPQPTPQLSTPQSVSQPVSQPTDRLFSQTFSPKNHTTDQSIIDSQAPQPQAFEQQFQSQIQSSALSGGDIIMDTQPSKKTKKNRIILISVIIMSMLVAVIICVIILIGRSKDVSVDNSFDKFINYLTNGDIAKSPTTDFDIKDEYMIDYYYFSGSKEERQAYFKQLKQLWENFVKNDDTKSEVEKEIISEINDNLSVINLSIDKGIIPAEEIFRQYIKGGEDGARTYYEDYYASENKMNEMEMQYIFYQDSYLNDILNVIKLYIANQCVNGDNIDEKCAEEKGIYETGDYKRVANSLRLIVNYTDEAEAQVKKSCEELIKIRTNG